MRRTRRRVLELGGAALATGLAGCLGGDGSATDTPDDGGTTPTDGGGEATPTVTATLTATPTDTPTPTATPTAAPPGDRPATDLSGFSEWLPAPSAVEFVPETGYASLGIAPAQLVERGDALGDGATDSLTRETAVPGIDTLADATVALRFARSAQVYEADFDRATAESEFEDLGFSPVDTYRGYTIVTPGSDTAGSSTRAAAVGDGSIVIVGRYSSEEKIDKRPATEAVIDAKTGNAERYADATPDFGRLVDALGNTHVLVARTHETGASFEGATGEGLSTHVGAEESRVRASAAFAEGADGAALADWASDAESFHGREPSTTVDGRVATAAALVPTGEIAEFPSEYPGPPILGEDVSVPQINLEFEYEESADGQGILTITHQGGDAAAADRVFVRGSGFAEIEGADRTAAGPWQGSASGDDGELFAGDFIDVGVTSDYGIRIVWEAGEGDAAATLAEDRGPDA
ncbi:hypothetical protein BRC78_02790 [Halobacteriales archaeon QH_8_68_33]|nr:MAG: hypothetical protein BRC78_02790 [Halobacteriales archaeon QH_8_68_33]